MAEVRARCPGVWIVPDGPSFLVYQEPPLPDEQPARFSTREQAEGAAHVIAAAECCSIHYFGTSGRQTLHSGAA